MESNGAKHSRLFYPLALILQTEVQSPQKDSAHFYDCAVSAWMHQYSPSPRHVTSPTRRYQNIMEKSSTSILCFGTGGDCIFHYLSVKVDLMGCTAFLDTFLQAILVLMWVVACAGRVASIRVGIRTLSAHHVTFLCFALNSNSLVNYALNQLYIWVSGFGQDIIVFAIALELQ